VEPTSWTTAERLRLNFPPHQPPGNATLRLACQVRVGGAQQHPAGVGESSVVVAKYNGFWGHGDLQLEDYQGELDAAAHGERGVVGPQQASKAQGAEVNRAREPKSRLGVGMLPLGRVEFLLDPDERDIGGGGAVS
jgi:hypothetical protein